MMWQTGVGRRKPVPTFADDALDLGRKGAG
jgi:hypothetical protein